MKILIAPDSFKGTFAAKDIATRIAEVGGRIIPQATFQMLPLADGGEGTVDCILDVLSGAPVTCQVHDPLGRMVTANYGIVGNTAIMEMAAASGYHLIRPDERDIMHSNTYGTGEMILDAVRRGCRKIYLGIGGSITNDGGMGALSALGARFLRDDETVIEAVPANFKHVQKVEIPSCYEGTSVTLDEVVLTLMCDVRNPLLGANGATAIFGPQKGASQENLVALECGLAHYAGILERDCGRNIRYIAGAGASGGLSAGLLAMTRSTIQPGIEAILSMVGFDKALEGADLVITGEGHMDAQSAQGKVVSGVAHRCKERGIPCIAFVGGTSPDASVMYQHGITKIVQCSEPSMSIEYALAHADTLADAAAEQMFRELV